MTKMRKDLDDICDSLDAAIFSGDGFHNAEALAELKSYLARWGRAIPHMEEMVKLQAEPWA